MNKSIVTEDLPPAQTYFLELIEEGKTTFEAAILAFPEKNDALAYARKVLNDNDLGRSLAFVRMQKVGLSINENVDNLKEANDLARSDPKSSTALLNCVKLGFDFYNLLPKQEKVGLTINNNTQLNLNTDEGRKKVVSDYYEQAQKELPKEEIATFIESGTIGEVEVLSKEDLFDNGDN